MISLALVLLLTPLAVFLSRWIRSRLALPLLTAVAGYFPFVMEAQISFLRGFLILLLWTVVLSVLILWMSFKESETMNSLIWRSKRYSNSMFEWIETGHLPEGSRGQVIVFHAKQALLYCVLAFLSANFLSLVLGSALLNYMNFYVSQLAMESRNPAKAFVLGWNPWSVIRVVSFLYLGMAVSTLSMSLFFAIPWRYNWMLFLPAIAGISLDTFLKLALSRPWSKKLQLLLLRNKI